MAYVLKNTETEAPKGLRDALATGNRWLAFSALTVSRAAFIR